MEEYESKIISNNRKISTLLKENEDLLKAAGFPPPASDWQIPKEGAKIHFPEGYIRPNQYYIKKYKLNDIVCVKSVRKNIAYSFQLADYYSYFINRFHILGSVSIMFYKHDIINLVSIMEALATSATTRISVNCPKQLKKSLASGLYPNKRQQIYLKSAIDWAKSNNITHLTNQQIHELDSLYELRNHVHILKDAPYKYGSKDFNKSNHDMAANLVEQLADDISAHWVQYYSLPLHGCRPQK